MSRRPHGDIGLSRRDLDTDPIAQLRAWLADAEAAKLLFPEAVALATADAQGRPAVRHVLLKVIDERGLVFFSNYESRKGRHLSENPHAALAIVWKELDRQVSVAGTVERAGREESELYFRSRPREAQIGAWASRQSRPVASRQELDARFDAMSRRFEGSDVPLPPHWGGFRLTPHMVEFWKGRSHRLHDRFVYTREPGDSWRLERLFP